MFASQASWVWKGEIFLACNPGSWKEGGAQKLKEDEAGGWGCQIPGSCKRGGPKGLVCPGPRARGSFFRGGSAALRRIDRAKNQAGAEGRDALPGAGVGRGPGRPGPSLLAGLTHRALQSSPARPCSRLPLGGASWRLRRLGDRQLPALLLLGVFQADY